ncbi:unnamed protein product, partial [Hapterophycus canaliculatus]
GDGASSRQGTPTPEGFALSAGLAATDSTASAPAPVPAPAAGGLPRAVIGGGVEETKGEDRGDVGDLEGVSFPETREAGAGTSLGGGSGVAESTARESGSQIEEEGREAGENGEIRANGGGGVAEAAGGEVLAYGVGGPAAGDPESTRLEQSTPLREDEVLPQGRQEAQRRPYVNGGGGELPLLVAAGGGAAAGGREMDARAGPAGADAGAVAADVSTTTAAAAAAPSAAAQAPTTTSVTEPHLKTAGQPLTHGNRAESPTGMSTDLQDKLKALKLRRKHRFVTMRIEGTEVVAETLGAPGEGAAELKVALPYSDCRYAVYDQEIVTADGRKANKLFFFTWLPHNATPHNKMAYSHGKVTVRQRLEGLYDVAASSFEDVEVALGLVDEDEEDSDIEF